MPVHKAVEKSRMKCEQQRAAELERELYPPLPADAPELTHGLDEAEDLEDWKPEDGTG